MRESLSREFHAENLEKSPSWILVIFYKSKNIFWIKKWKYVLFIYINKQ